MVTVTECTTLGKGRLRFHLDNGTELVLYRGEAKQFRMREGSTLSDEEEHQLIYEVVGKRAKRRTMHLLEQMDRTEQQLREKLKQGGYPQACIDLALEYVKSFHYVDDYRYACTHINYRQDRMSRYQLKVKLYGKGVPGELVDVPLRNVMRGTNRSRLSGCWKRKSLTHKIPTQKNLHVFTSI